MSIQELRSNLRDVARVNRFTLNLTGGMITQLNYPRNFQFLVSKAAIPKKDFTGPIIKYRGSSINLIGDYKHDPLTLTLWNDTEQNARIFFENWLDEIFDVRPDENSKADNDLIRFGNTAVLSVLGQNGRRMAVYSFLNVIPLEISEIELDQSSENTLQEFTVGLHYSHWEVS